MFSSLYHVQDFDRTWVWVACRVSYKKQELITLREYLWGFNGVRVARHLNFLCLVLFCLSSFCVLCPTFPVVHSCFKEYLYIKALFKCVPRHRSIKSCSITTGLQLVSYLITQSVFASWGCRVFRIEWFHHHIMAMRKLTLAERWQAVGISQAGLSNRRVAGQMGLHHSVFDRRM